ncbi:hypothetical protein [Spirosoma pollinicola]|uniref:Lipoprotein n=1 Tax=Spirosoma pollinicola TaxID=2057025 RepID=A0A2K8YS79_9BACT|nr:hypothetical protein [Spirosoma pollinicola]AUD00482.1 hypothetical protein CWM47_00780 [Spirosoma pollinicola]
MKFTIKISLCLLIMLSIACDSDLLKSSYKELGTFDTKLEAQNKAITHILSQYGSLPQNEYYKVIYSFRDADPGDFSRNSMWYHKASNELAIEVDIHSGMACQWKQVSKTVLQQAAMSKKSLNKVDSLSRPNQELGRCL